MGRSGGGKENCLFLAAAANLATSGLWQRIYTSGLVGGDEWYIGADSTPLKTNFHFHVILMADGGIIWHYSLFHKPPCICHHITHIQPANPNLGSKSNRELPNQQQAGSRTRQHDLGFLFAFLLLLLAVSSEIKKSRPEFRLSACRLSPCALRCTSRIQGLAFTWQNEGIRR